MSLKAKLSDTMKTAMKAQDKDRLAFARNLHAQVRKKEIDDRIDLDDAGIVKIAMSSLKQRQDSIEQFKAGGRDDLVAKEEAEAAFLKEFLPQQMSESEIRDAVKQAVAESGAAGPKDMGKLMKVLMPKVQGRADGRIVQQLVKETLGQ